MPSPAHRSLHPNGLDSRDVLRSLGFTTTARAPQATEAETEGAAEAAEINPQLSELREPRQGPAQRLEVEGIASRGAEHAAGVYLQLLLFFELFDLSVLRSRPVFSGPNTRREAGG